MGSSTRRWMLGCFGSTLVVFATFAWFLWQKVCVSPLYNCAIETASDCASADRTAAFADSSPVFAIGVVVCGLAALAASLTVTYVIYFLCCKETSAPKKNSPGTQNLPKQEVLCFHCLVRRSIKSLIVGLLSIESDYDGDINDLPESVIPDLRRAMIHSSRATMARIMRLKSSECPIGATRDGTASLEKATERLRRSVGRISAGQKTNGKSIQEAVRSVRSIRTALDKAVNKFEKSSQIQLGVTKS